MIAEINSIFQRPHRINSTRALSNSRRALPEPSSKVILRTSASISPSLPPPWPLHQHRKSSSSQAVQRAGSDFACTCPPLLSNMITSLKQSSTRCEEFAKRGCIVYATSRKVETMEGLSHPSIRKIALDVTSDESVQSAIEQVLSNEGKIDILGNNAAVACFGALLIHRMTWDRKRRSLVICVGLILFDLKVQWQTSR